MAANKSHEASSSSSSSSRRGWRYDVFLSFRGEDTRRNFTDHLYIALQDAGINVFRDDNELRVGENISTELLEAIQDSRISIIVLSRDYAASSWCLEELVKIMECRETVQQVVQPVFYKVDPSDVRKQSGSFKEAFGRHEERFTTEKEKVLRWRNALTEAANLKGFHYTPDRLEGAFIKEIVNKILNHVNNTCLNEAIYPVGLEPRVQKVNSLLSVGYVRIIGICAMGGMGKTTIAKAIYNNFFYCFEHKSFLANVREISEHSDGQVRLQEKLLSDILKRKNIKVSNNIDLGINVIKERLRNKKVLIVLDDVDELEQLRILAITKGDWFGLGSRIIITTRDKHLLEQIEADHIYMVEKLNDEESLELFSRHAFSRSHPEEDYVGLSKDIICYCQGLPLALTVLGSLLINKGTSFWEDTLKMLKSIPHEGIQKKLKISYDALNRTQQAIFLDVACFFIGVGKDYAHAILDGCGFFPENGITTLISRCLLTIECNKLMMHDLLRDMGREIVCEECAKELGKRSRLWKHDDVLYVLKNHKGTEAVEGIILELSTQNEEHLSTKAFANMHNLRLLQLNYVQHLTGSYGHFSKELKWVCWHGFPLNLIPENFHLENLVVLDMRYSNLRQFSKEIKVLNKLKVLNLSHSYYLTKTPNFSKIPNLEDLELKDCTSLVKVHSSIGNLHRLVLLDMRDCKQLKSLPNSICKLKALKILNLCGCSKFERLPQDMRDMEALVELRADQTAIRQVPPLKNIENLSLCGWTGLTSRSTGSVFWPRVSPRKSRINSVNLHLLSSLLGLTSLRRLKLNNCNLSDEVISKDFGSLSSLEELDLSGNNFCCLPARISTLPKLERLNVDCCESLVSLPELPASLRHLSVEDCSNFVNLPANFSDLPKLCTLYFDSCTSLQSIPDLPRNCRTLRADSCTSLERFPNVPRSIDRLLLHLDLARCPNLVASAAMDAIPQCSLFLSLPLMGFGLPLVSLILNPHFLLVEGDEIPSYFCHQSMSPSLCLPVLCDFEDAMLDVCILYEDQYWGSQLWLRRYGGLVLRSGDQLELQISEKCGYQVNKWGVHLDEGGTIQSNGVNQILHNICSQKDYFIVNYDGGPFGIDINIDPTLEFLTMMFAQTL